MCMKKSGNRSIEDQISTARAMHDQHAARTLHNVFEA